MSDLAEFLMARIAAEQADADTKHDRLDCDLTLLETFGECSCGHPARVLARCEADRRIVERCRPRYAILYRESERLLAEAFSQTTVKAVAHSGPIWPFEGAEATLRDLASVYANHPDYREEWASDVPR